MSSSTDGKDFTILLKNNPQSSQLLDSAFGQKLITVNEFRLFLGLDEIVGGNVAKDGQSLDRIWPIPK